MHTVLGGFVIGLLSCASYGAILVDFGSVQTTPSPDGNGNSWNNFNVGGVNLTLSDTSGVTTGIVLTYTTGVAFSGNTGVTASLPSLGSLNVPSALIDSAFTTDSIVGNTFKLANLNPTSTYTLEIFGSRDAASMRTTTYTVEGLSSSSFTVATSGTAIGLGGQNFNTGNLATFTSVAPSLLNEISVNYRVSQGGFAYVNAMRVTEHVVVPEPASASAMGVIVFLARRRHR